VAEIYGKHIFSKRYFREFVKGGTSVCHGAFDDRKLIGFFCERGDNGGVVYLDFLFMRKEQRRKGIGSSLLEKAEEWALSHKYHYLWLFTESENNIAYYQKRGFRHVGVHEKAWFGVNEHVMAKSLRSEPFPEMFERYLKKKK